MYFTLQTEELVKDKIKRKLQFSTSSSVIWPPWIILGGRERRERLGTGKRTGQYKINASIAQYLLKIQPVHLLFSPTIA